MAKTADPLLFNLPSLHNNDSTAINRTKRGMYKLDNTPDKKLEEQRKCLSNLSSLSLLKSKNQTEEEANNEVVGERPVTPINETIRFPPKLFSVLSKHIRRRINPRPHWDHISIEDQRSLGAVLLGEVNAIWPILRQQVDDPFLTSRQNKELQRRISVHIVAVCEQLFLYHCNQFKTLTKRGIFSTEANMSRTRGQIALDADKYLNVLAVRRHITSDLKKFVEHDTMKATKRSDPITQQIPITPHHLSFKGLLKSSRPQQKKKPDYNMSVELRDMYVQMPTLDIGKVYTLLPPAPTAKNQTYQNDDIFSQENITDTSDTEYQALSERKVRKWVSEPKLFTQDLFADSEKKVDYDELESRLTHSQQPSRPTTRLSVVEQVMNASLVTASAPASACRCITYRSKQASDVIDTKQDLIDLLARDKTSNMEDCSITEDQDIPPLIQAITRREIKTKKMQELRKCEEELNARKKMAEEKENLPLPQPNFPQPSIVQVRLPGHSNPINHQNVTIRTCDLQIPEKVDLPAVTLDLYGPLFNDLTGEISAATVKGLDSNLFQGEELKEVYTEIMNTVPDSHLDFDNDPMVVTPAVKVTMSEILASSSLDCPRAEQIINPKLTKTGQQPPWADEPQDLWEKKIHMPSNESIGSAMMDEALNKNSRAYASWLAWWKATITTDDYFKYLATQDTDFLGVIFHFYDSEATTSETDSFARSALLEEERKRNERLLEIKAKKEHFVKGLWNANVVALGGLGKYPDVEDEDGTIMSEDPMSNISPRSSTVVPSNPSDLSLQKNTLSSNKQQNAIKSQTSETSTEFQLSSETLETVADSTTTAYTDSNSIAPSPSGNFRKVRPLGKGLINERNDSIADSLLSFEDIEYETSVSSFADDQKKSVSTQDENSSAIDESKMTVLSKKSPKTKPINLLRGYYNIPASATSKSTQEKSIQLEPEPLTVQARLEVVWKKLRMSGAQKLNTALKYSSDAYMPVLEESLIAWEKVTDLIVSREKYLFDLEAFERDASDPARFFSKGTKGSSVSRLQEAKLRAKILKKLSSLEKQISVLLELIQSTYDDTITYAGRAYQEKMNSDKVEMLYWLQQERRCKMLDDFGQPKELYNFRQNNHTLVGPKQITLSGLPE